MMGGARINWDVTDYNFCMSVYLPVHRDGEDGLDVGQHCVELLRILLEAHFCQHHRLADILGGKHKMKNDHIWMHRITVMSTVCLWGVSVQGCWHWQRILLSCCLHLVDVIKNCTTEARCDYHSLPSCPDTLMGAPLQNAPLPFRAVYIFSSMQL